MRQEACEARLVADERWQRDHEQTAKDVYRAILLLRQQEPPPELPEPIAADGTAHRPGRPQLRVIMGGLAAVAGLIVAFSPPAEQALAATFAVHHHRIAALHDHRRGDRRDPDPNATMRA